MGRQPVAYAVAEDETDAAKLKLMAAQVEELKRQSRKLYDHSNPVDEYESSLGVPASNMVEIQPSYEIAERIECIFASLPVGITAATLQLGDRQIVLYNGAATVLQTIVTVQGTGMILNRNDVRRLTFTGAPTTGFYIGLTGHTMESDGWQR